MQFDQLRIKVHKEGCPGRLVINQIKDPTYKMCKVLTDILNPLDEQADSFLKNSKQLKEELKMLVIDENCVMGSQDIKSMYPMIPLEKTLKLRNEQLKKDNSLKERTKWLPKQITDLLRICLETNFWTFEGNVCTQTDDTPIGKSISGPLAGIFVARLEEQFIKNGKLRHRSFFGRG